MGGGSQTGTDRSNQRADQQRKPDRRKHHRQGEHGDVDGPGGLGDEHVRSLPEAGEHGARDDEARQCRQLEHERQLVTRPGAKSDHLPQLAPSPERRDRADPRSWTGGNYRWTVSDPGSELPPPLTLARLLVRGLARRCPVCGGGRLFHRWFTIVEHCPRCGFRLERIEGHWIGALGVNTVVSVGTVLVAVIAAFVVTYPDGSATAAVAVVVAVAIIVPLAFFPVSKTLWCAIDLAMRPLEPDDEVDPRWIPRSTHHEA